MEAYFSHGIKKSNCDFILTIQTYFRVASLYLTIQIFLSYNSAILKAAFI